MVLDTFGARAPTRLLLVPTTFRRPSIPSFNFFSREELEVENFDTDLEDKKNGVVVGLHFVTVFVGAIIEIFHGSSSTYLYPHIKSSKMSVVIRYSFLILRFAAF